MSIAGYYMYIEANKVNVGHVARLMTPLLRGTPDPAQPSCLIFWYDMYGKDVDSLNVYVTYPGATAFPGDLVWSLAGNRGDQWRGAEVVLNITVDFQVPGTLFTKPFFFNDKFQKSVTNLLITNQNQGFQ